MRLEGWGAACFQRAGQEEEEGAAAALVPEPWLAFRQGNGENAKAWSKLRRKTVRLPARIIIHEYERTGIDRDAGMALRHQGIQSGPPHSGGGLGSPFGIPAFEPFLPGASDVEVP